VAVRGDVAVAEDIVRLFDQAEQALGPVTALVKNAGTTGRITRFDALDLATLRRVIEVSLIGTLLCAQEAVRRFSTVRGGRGGSILNLCSVAAALGSPGEYVHYAATKAAVERFTIGLAREVAREAIHVNAGHRDPRRRRRPGSSRLVDHPHSARPGRRARGDRRGHRLPAVAGRLVHGRRRAQGVGRPARARGR
jgi:NAD(P)-dependent dehydrogenase (short-subunit alcohol dehydrogenase family)